MVAEMDQMAAKMGSIYDMGSINASAIETAASSLRNVYEEALLITNTTIWNDGNDDTLDAQDILYEACMSKVKSCTLGEGDSLEVNGCDWTNFKKSVDQGKRQDESCRHRALDFELYALDRELQ